MKRVREFLESIVFAGLKPSGQKTDAAQMKWLGPLRGPVERLLSGGPAPTDPLYLTNRPLSHKLRSWALVAVPCLLLVIGIGYTLSSLMDPPEAKPQKEMTAKEVASKLLPNVDPNLKLASNPDIQVVEIAVHHDAGSRLVGAIRNTATHDVAAVELVVDLTDVTGSQVGGVSGTILKVPANSDKSFSIPIKQKDAAFALVREITSK
ncbi:MAG: hypothetical protein JWP63_3921 [Candidatus Solibacter sp.]|nr:hypothetical protein [Candidatus Solibacter sp.]